MMDGFRRPVRGLGCGCVAPRDVRPYLCRHSPAHLRVPSRSLRFDILSNTRPRAIHSQPICRTSRMLFVCFSSGRAFEDAKPKQSDVNVGARRIRRLPGRFNLHYMIVGIVFGRLGATTFGNWIRTLHSHFEIDRSFVCLILSSNLSLMYSKTLAIFWRRI